MMTRCDLHDVDVDRRGCPWCQLEEAQETAGRYYEDGRKMKVELDEALERVEKWKVWHDSACEDAKKWRQDAQELQGILNDIRAELQSRAIHLLSKHCWCEPTGHPWTQQGTVAE